MPRQLLNRIEKLIDETAVANRGYGLDSSVEVLRLDRNGNGTIEPNGTDIDGSGRYRGRREGPRLPLLRHASRRQPLLRDSTSRIRDAPRLMWRIGENDAHIAVTDPEFLPGVGQTWSAPTIARVNVSGHSFTDNPDKFVLIFGGGYDTTQDQIPYQPDGVGNRVYMVDAISGELLWRAGPSTRHRRRPQAREDDQLDSGRSPRRGPDRRRLRGPHVCRRPRWPRLAIRHLQRTGAIVAGHGWRVRFARRGRQRHQAGREQPALLLCTGRGAAQERLAELDQRRDRLRSPREAGDGHDRREPLLQPARLQRVHAIDLGPVQGELRERDAALPPDHHRRGSGGCDHGRQRDDSRRAGRAGS